MQAGLCFSLRFYKPKSYSVFKAENIVFSKKE
jgi:hypothetical protein